MIANPRPGQLAQVWYNRRVAPIRPLHGQVGRVVVRGRGPGPKNHGILLGGVLCVVPCGNLRKVGHP